jgi:HK97 family phage prohead protease
MEIKNKEVRTIYDDMAEIRSNEGTRIIEGYGIVFNRESQDLGGFTELIKPEAIKGVLEKSDIFVYMNHNRSRGVLARSNHGKGSLKTSVDSKGVKYSFDVPKFDLGNELIQGVQRGDISGSSFSFTTKEDKWTKRGDGTILRTVTKFDRIFDLSPVYNEAYEDTTVALRSLDELKQTDNFTSCENADPVIGDVAANLENSDHERIITEREVRLRRINNNFKLKNKLK